MRLRFPALLSGLTVFAVLAAPIRPAAQQRQQNDRAGNVDEGVTNPVPFVNQPLVPDAVAPGGPEFTLTVNGTGFVSGSVVNWNGGTLATTFVSSSQLTVTVPAADIAAASTASVTVANPNPGGGTSNVALFPITSATSSVSLIRSDYATGSAPPSVTTADFNGDGKLDLAVANQNSNTVSILLGNGDGTFQSQVDYAAGSHAYEICVGDFNGDGKQDLAVADNTTEGAVSILLGNGDGTFQAPASYSINGSPEAVAVGDFNGDGNPDLVTANNNTPGTVSVLLGNGDGTFRAPVDYEVGGEPVSVAVGDLNGDGKLDLAVTDYGSAVGTMISILLGNGDGTFQTQTEYVTGSAPRWVTMADLNGDGKLDLAVANQDSTTVSVFLGKGDGTFQPRMDFTTGFGPTSVIAADFNGDGRLDLSTANFSFGSCCGKTVSILLGNGDGTFQAHMDYATPLGPNQVAVGDFNGDGTLDLASANFNSNSVSVLLQSTTVSLSGNSLKFPTQLVGTTSAAQTVTLTNTGAISLTVSNVTITGTNSTDFGETNTCNSGVPPGGSCTIRVTFNPTAKGTRTGALTITDNAAGSPQTVSLTGTGTVVELTPALLNFGSQKVGTTSSPRTITLTNTGSTPLGIRGISIDGPDFGDFAYTTTCTSSLAPKSSCAINVTFTPAKTGKRGASVRVQDSGGGSPQEAPLIGEGT